MVFQNVQLVQPLSMLQPTASRPPRIPPTLLPIDVSADADCVCSGLRNMPLMTTFTTCTRVQRPTQSTCQDVTARCQSLRRWSMLFRGTALHVCQLAPSREQIVHVHVQTQSTQLSHQLEHSPVLNQTNRTSKGCLPTLSITIYQPPMQTMVTEEVHYVHQRHESGT